MTFQKDIQNNIQRIKLSEEERDRMDDAVLSFMESNPIQKKGENNQSATERITTMKNDITETTRSFASLFVRRLSYAALALVLAIAIGGGTVMASQNALPGDALYGVKVNVAEELQSRFTSDEKAKAEWEAERVRRRLLEINTLFEQDGTVADSALLEVKGHITDHSQAVALATNKLGVLGDSDAILDIVVQLQETLEIYKSLLTEIVEQEQGGVNPEVLNLIGNVEQVGQAAEALQLDTFFENLEEAEPEYVDDSVIETINLIQLLSPKTDDILVQGELFPITWDIDVENGRFMTMQLLDESGTVVGYVGANGFNVSSRKWNPQFIFDISGKPISSSVSPGQYRMLFQLEAYDGVTYQFTTGEFSIVEKSSLSYEIPVTYTPTEDADSEINDTPPVTSEKKHPSINLKQYVVSDAEIAPNKNGIITKWITYTTGPSEIGKVTIRCTKPSSVDVTFKYMDIEDSNGNKLGGSASVYATSPTEQAATFENIYLELAQSSPKDFLVRGYVIGDVPEHTVICGIVSQDDILFKNLSDGSAFSDNINEGQYSSIHIDDPAVPDFIGPDIEITSPTSLDEYYQGEQFGLSVKWKLNNPEVAGIEGYSELYTSSGDFVRKLYGMSSLSQNQFSWTISQNIPAGKYKIKIGAGDYEAFSEPFAVIEPESPEWEGTEAEMTWPQSFNSIIEGEPVNLAWKINNTAINGKKGYLSLVTASGKHEFDIGTVSTFSEKYYPWDVALPDDVLSGAYRIKIATDDGFSTMGEVFQLGSK
jgi:hypothetical protein